MNIDVVFSPYEGQLLSYTLPFVQGMMVSDAIERSGIAREYPDIYAASVGVFSKRVTWETLLFGGERVEIYRSLQQDPKMRRLQKSVNF